MEVELKSLERLLHSVCEDARESVRQSNEMVIQRSLQKLRTSAIDLHALRVVAASSLVREQPTRSLKLLHRHPDAFSLDAVSNRIAGYAWLVHRDPARARECFFHAVRLDPNQPDCWNWLGRIAEQEDSFDQAAEYYERGILFDDGGHQSALDLSRMHARQQQLADAIHTLRVCLIRDRRSPTLNLALAKLLCRRAVALGRRRRFVIQRRLRHEALECLRIVNAAAPSAASLITQGLLHQQLSEHSAALALFRRAAELEPNSAEATVRFAAANVDFGNLDDALEQFGRAISLEPDRGETHFRFTRAKRFEQNGQTRRYLDGLKTLAGRCDREKDRQKQIYIQFAIAKVHDDIGQYAEAWKHYDRANRLKMSRGRPPVRATRTSDSPPTRLSGLVDQAIAFFTPERFASLGGIGSRSPMPLFVVGMPRSGTTLTEQILSSHPEVAGAGELHEIGQIRCEIARRHDRAARAREGGAESYPDLLAATDPRELREQAEGYLTKLDQFRRDEVRVTDKMPTNFMHLGLIAILFPNATVVHCQRNPMDVLVSCYCQNLNAPFCDLEQLVSYHREYRRLMRHWERTLPIKIYTSQYESLVSDPETQSRGLVRHCGLPWNDACLQFDQNRRAVHTPSKWQVRQPIYRSSIEKWRRFESFLAPIAEQIQAEIATEDSEERSPRHDRR